VPELATYLAFVAATLTMQMVPGPDTVLVVSRGVGEGLRVALWTVFGMTVAAGLIQVPLLALGIASVVRSLPAAFELLRLAGAIYLVWLGTRLLLPSHGRRPQETVGLASTRSPLALAAAREGMIVNLTNPNPLIFMLAFLPQFVDPARGSVTAQLLVLGATQKGLGLAVLGTTALASGAVGEWLGRRPGLVAWQERLAGSMMIGLGLYLLVAAIAGRVEASS
jgi:threonine/homoserine/homoserine lactone efflux protein